MSFGCSVGRYLSEHVSVEYYVTVFPICTDIVIFPATDFL